MVDVESRRRASEIIKRFHDGGISNFDFEELWPIHDRRDRGLNAIRTLLWNFYDDGHEHTLTQEGHVLRPEGKALFDRCALFLRTDFEYGWPKDNFIGIGGLGLFGRILTLGLSTFLDRALRRRAERFSAEMRIYGPDPIWPFSTTQQYDSARQQSLQGDQSYHDS